MDQETLDKMNNSLAIAMVNPHAAGIVDKGWNMIGEFTSTHGHIGFEKFGASGVGDRATVIKLFIEDMHNKIMNPEKK